ALSGIFRFALRPYNPEGISTVYYISFDGSTLRADLHGLLTTWPRPDGWRLSGLNGGDLFEQLQARGGRVRRSLRDPHGLAHGVLEYGFHVEPGEEAEFLAFMAVKPVVSGMWPGLNRETSG